MKFSSLLGRIQHLACTGCLNDELLFILSVSRLRPVIFSEVESDKEYINNSMTIGTGLFELYLALQSISKYI